MNIISCEITTFSLKHKIYFNNELFCQCSFEEIFSNIQKLIFTQDIQKIHLFGNENFIEPIVDKIFTLYNNIIIEVN